MAVDLELTSNRDITIDPTGDYSTVSGQENIRQQHVNAIFRATEVADIGLLDQNGQEDFRIAIRRELDNLSYSIEHEIETEVIEGRVLQVTVESNAMNEPVSEEVSV